MKTLYHSPSECCACIPVLDQWIREALIVLKSLPRDGQYQSVLDLIKRLEGETL